MNISLEELVLTDGTEIYEMLQEIGPGETDFPNDAYNIEPNNFLAYLQKNFNLSQEIGLEANEIPQTTYWLYIEGKAVGYGTIKHHLNDNNLKKISGHIGFSIRPSERGKRYGDLILKELLQKAKDKGINEVVITCLENNVRSRKVIEGNNGKLSEISHGLCYYRVRIMDYTLREMEERDVIEVCNLIFELTGNTITPENMTDRLNLVKSSPIDELYVCEIEGMVQGILGFRIRHNIEEVSKFGEISVIVTKSSSRRSGIGRAMMKYAERMAKSKGCIGTWLVTGLDREEEAHNFYRSLGYKVNGYRFIKPFS